MILFYNQYFFHLPLVKIEQMTIQPVFSLYKHMAMIERKKPVIRQAPASLDFCIIISRMNVHRGDDEDISRV